MYKSAKHVALAILIALSSTVHALHIPRSIDPFKCHFAIKRFEEAYCARRLFKDLENRKEKKGGTPIHMNTCQSWDDAPFRGFEWSWQSCTYYQQPWRPEMGGCNLTLYTGPKCDETSHKMIMTDINKREVLSDSYESNCWAGSGENSQPHQSVRLFCNEPGYVAGF